MRFFAPLKHRAMAFLWSGQVLSSLGDEVNRVATVWLASELFGARAGYLSALGAAVAVVCGLLGGPLTERFSRARVMVLADIVRGIAVLVVPIAAAMGAPLVFVLIPMVIVLSGARTFFDPAMRASLGVVVPTPAQRHATNALMESTDRLARVMGPGLVALLGAVVPLIDFFAVDALTFFSSAASIGLIATVLSRDPKATDVLAKSSLGGLTPAMRDPLLRHALLSGFWVNAAWSLFFPLGIALCVKALTTDVRALGLVIASYGVGNLSSTVLLGSLEIRRPERLFFLGRCIAGIGFLGMALAPSLPVLMAVAVLTATGGPAVDLGFMSVVQERYQASEAARVYRTNLTITYAGLLVVFLAAPGIIDALGRTPVLVVAALGIVVPGIIGFVRFGGRAPSASVDPSLGGRA